MAHERRTPSNPFTAKLLSFTNLRKSYLRVNLNPTQKPIREKIVIAVIILGDQPERKFRELAQSLRTDYTILGNIALVIAW